MNRKRLDTAYKGKRKRMTKTKEKSKERTRVKQERRDQAFDEVEVRLEKKRSKSHKLQHIEEEAIIDRDLKISEELCEMEDLSELYSAFQSKA